MRFYEEKGIAACGLACPVCREEACAGCAKKGCPDTEKCGVLRCVREKGVKGCHECAAFPCSQPAFAHNRSRAFVRYRQKYGTERLMQDLRRNWEAGIVYHRADGLKGDYDAQLDERAVMDMLAFGRDYDPYATCPVFETDHFRLRLVCQGDAADLLACYADPLVRPIFNADNCTSDFCYDTVEEMSACIQFFMDMYEQRCFVRWSILDKHSGRAVGTMEMFSGDGEFGVLRIDLASAYEKEPFLHELLSLANERFHLLFQTEAMVVKAIPQAQERRKALEKCGYVPFAIEGREHFFVHRE